MGFSTPLEAEYTWVGVAVTDKIETVDAVVGTAVWLGDRPGI